MKILLQELELTLSKFNPCLLELLSLGLDPNTVEMNLKKVGINFGRWADIYCWRDGLMTLISTISQYDFCSFGKLIPLVSSIGIYKTNITNGIWSDGFFPIIEEGGGGYLLLNLMPSHPNFGNVHVYSPSLLITEKPEPIYDSFQSFIKTVIVCYNHHIFSTKDNGINLIIDYQREQDISKTMNPKSSFWKSN